MAGACTPLRRLFVLCPVQVACNAIWSVLCLLWELQTALVFGTLRAEEQKVLSECFWQYVLLKVVFLGVILDPSVYEGGIWGVVLLTSGFWKLGLLLAQEIHPTRTKGVA